uniref:Ubiquitin-like domain-containing protein n=1 Tax=Acrobeloides nanus TaxID=290746 RepID=A0A914ECY6_9BILA
MEFFVRLHDAAGVVHKKFQPKFDDGATLNELKEKIKSILKIDNDYQLLYSVNGDEITGLDSTTLAGLNLKNGDTIIVKHLNVDVWDIVIKRAVEIKKKDTIVQPEVAQHTLDLIKLLEESKFFNCYYRLLDEMERISGETKEFFGGDSVTMQTATQQFFFDYLKAQDILRDPRSFAVNFERKIGGIHPGCVATVCYDGTNDKYFIKTHHTGPTKTSYKSALPPNLREVFAYVLLEAIGLGPECHFYGPIPGDYKMNLDEFLTNKPQCVDTKVNFREVGQMSAFAQTIDANTRMKVGKNLVQAWKMSECVDAAVKEVTSVKERIRAKGGIIEDTDDFNKYAEGVKHNISLFSN